MKRVFGKLLVAGLVCAGIAFAGLTAQAKEKEGAAKKEGEKKEAVAKPKTTVTGAAKAVANKTDATKKHLELTDKDGASYMLLGKTLTQEEVTKYDGKNVSVKGTVKEKDGKKTLYVSEIEEAK